MTSWDTGVCMCVHVCACVYVFTCELVKMQDTETVLHADDDYAPVAYLKVATPVYQPVTCQWLQVAVVVAAAAAAAAGNSNSGSSRTRDSSSSTTTRSRS